MKHYEKRRSVSSKMFVMMLALVLVFGCAVGGTIAWLTATTGEVVNTFTYGDIKIDLFEHNYDATTNTLGSTEVKEVENYKIIPGKNLPKDPTVRVEAGSEACWLFVKVEADGTFVEGDVMYSVRTGTGEWTQGDGTSIPANVYYREVNATDARAGKVYYVLTGDTTYPNGMITVKDTLTKEDIKDITTNPTLTFTAYAVQMDGINSAADAWAKVAPTTTNP